MLSKRNKLALIVFFLSLLLACTTTPSTTSEDNDALVVIPKNCHREGYEIYISTDLDYCFAYPKGYYIAQSKSEEPVEIAYCNNPPKTENLTEEDLDAIMQLKPLVVSLSVEHENFENEISLKSYATRKPEESTTDELIPWSLFEEEAYLSRGFEQQEDAQKTSYFIYTQHQATFYTLGFHSTCALSEQSESGKELENLVFLVLETFTFIDK